MYRILGADQKEYGPVSAEVLRQWIQAGRATGRTLARAEGEAGWKPLSDFPEFAEALGVQAGAPPAHARTASGAPPDTVSVKPGVNNPTTLVCPSDPKVTYEYVSPGLKEEEALQVVIFRCPVHGHELFGDGSVHQVPRRTRAR
jgi:hypothetical protein